MAVAKRTRNAANSEEKLPRFDVRAIGGKAIPVPRSEIFITLSSIGGELPKGLDQGLRTSDNMYMRTNEDGAEVVFRETETPLNTGDLHATIRGEQRIKQGVIAITEYQNNIYLVYVDPERRIQKAVRIGRLERDGFDWAAVEKSLS